MPVAEPTRNGSSINTASSGNADDSVQVNNDAVNTNGASSSSSTSPILPSGNRESEDPVGNLRRELNRARDQFSASYAERIQADARFVETAYLLLTRRRELLVAEALSRGERPRTPDREAEARYIADTIVAMAALLGPAADVSWDSSSSDNVGSP